MTATEKHPLDYASDPHALARELAMPVLLVDHQVTRRQRLHYIAYPDDDPVADTHLARLLDHAGDAGYRTLLLVGTDLDNTLLACYITLEPLPQPEESSHG